AALHHVTNPSSFKALMDMRSEAVDLQLRSCTPTGHGDYDCIFRHTYPTSMHDSGYGQADFIAAPAVNPGWYMYLFEDCGCQWAGPGRWTGRRTSRVGVGWSLRWRAIGGAVARVAIRLIAEQVSGLAAEHLAEAGQGGEADRPGPAVLQDGQVDDGDPDSSSQLGQCHAAASEQV